MQDVICERPLPPAEGCLAHMRSRRRRFCSYAGICAKNPLARPPGTSEHRRLPSYKCCSFSQMRIICVYLHLVAHVICLRRRSIMVCTLDFHFGGRGFKPRSERILNFHLNILLLRFLLPSFLKLYIHHPFDSPVRTAVW